jgi:hypothetical protein
MSEYSGKPAAGQGEIGKWRGTDQGFRVPENTAGVPPPADIGAAAAAIKGRSVGDYQLLEEIARGGMGV